MFFDHDSPGASPEPPSPRGMVVWTRNKFLTGLAVMAPLIVTFWVLQFVYNTLHDWSMPLQKFTVDSVNDAFGRQIIDPTSMGFIIFERCVGVMIPLAVLVALGTLASNVIGRKVVGAIDQLLLRVPFISFIYKSLKQVIDAFKSFGGKQSFKRVVYIDYPSPGMWMLGFVTGQFHDRKAKKNMSLVFVPGALSPMTGLLLAVENERLTDAPMSMEDAMKMIFSGGLVPPDMPAAAAPGTVPMPGSGRRDLPPGLPVADADDAVVMPAKEAPSVPSAISTGGLAGVRRAVTSWLGM